MAAADDEVNNEHDSHPTEICSKEIEDIIEGEVKSTVKESGPKEMVTLVEEALDDHLRKSFNNGQRGTHLS